MKVAEKPMTSIGNLGSGGSIGITTKKNSEILDVFCRDDNVIMSILEEGDITVVRTFMVVSPYTDMDHIQQKPFRFITRLQTTQPSWWTAANGYHSQFYPMNYYIFEVIQ